MVLRSITQRRNSTDTCKSSPPIMIMADHLLHFHSEAAESPPSTVGRTITNRSGGARRASIAQLIFGPSSASNTPLTSRRATATAGDLSKSSSGFAHDSNNDNNNIYASLVREFEQHSPSPSNRRSWSQQLTLSSVTNHHHQSKTMGRCMRVVVAGPKEVGKTAILNQLACLNDITNEASVIMREYLINTARLQPYIPTIDDTYSVQMDGGERPPREVIVFHDTAGVPSYATVELRRPYIQVADAFLLIYSVCDGDSFNRVDLLKKFIDRQFGKEKKEVPIVVLGNMIDRPKREVDFNFVNNWAQRERVKFYEVTATDRRTLVDPIIFLASRYFHPPKESKFSLTKKLKPEKSGASIVMDL